MSKTYVVASQRPWNTELADRLTARTGARFHQITRGEQLTAANLDSLAARYVFFAHWSDRIPDEVWQRFECVIFHMTEVPYGRGGSPLQNLIVRGHTSTVVSALRCVADFDAGPVYVKRPLSLEGSAAEIFSRADRVIEDMIVEIIEREPTPVEQAGEVTVFRRRKSEESDVSDAASLDEWYDRIRMVDAPGYPQAYLDVGAFRLEFTNARRANDGVEARVMIRERANGTTR